MSGHEDYYWSEEVHPKWHPPKGFFSQSAEDIARGLKDNSDSLRQAMDRLDFYINRAGDKLEDPDKFERAKEILHNLYRPGTPLEYQTVFGGGARNAESVNAIMVSGSESPIPEALA